VSSGVDHLYVITGGPGSGKTTLVDALEQDGFARSMEAGRGIIQDQRAICGPGLPWEDRVHFAELMLSWEMRSHHIARTRCVPVFMDRGIPDVIGYLRLTGLPIPAHVERAAELFRYNSLVFLAPPWPEIFQQDQERRQDYEEAIRTFDAMREVYGELGYRLVELPRSALPDRQQFVLATINGLR